MADSTLYFGPRTNSQKLPLEIEAERHSLAKLQADREEYGRYRANSLLTTPDEEHPAIAAKWRQEIEHAELRHVARLAYFAEHVLGRPAPPAEPSQPRPVAFLRMNAMDPKSVVPEPQSNLEGYSVQRHAESWWTRNEQDIRAAAGKTKVLPVSRHDYYTPGVGLRDRYLEKLIRQAIEADGYELAF